MRTYRIVFKASGILDVEARNQKEAEEKFEHLVYHDPSVMLVEATSESVEDVTGRIPEGGIKL
jgi:hypothetical protein